MQHRIEQEQTPTCFPTEHQLFWVSERSISIDFLSHPISNAFLDMFPNVSALMQALWQARWPVAGTEGFVTPRSI